MLVSCGLTASFKCWGLPGSSSGRKHQRPLSGLSGRQSSSSAPEVCSGGFSYMSVETRRGLLPVAPSSSLHGNHRMFPVPITPSIHCSSFSWPEFHAFRWKGNAWFHFLSPCLYIHTLWGERDTSGMSSWQHFLEIQAKEEKLWQGLFPESSAKHTHHTDLTSSFQLRIIKHAQVWISLRTSSHYFPCVKLLSFHIYWDKFYVLFENNLKNHFLWILLYFSLTAFV